ncbi:hypothetical protein pdam_00025777, partial [Pocillopora damicornis]
VNSHLKRAKIGKSQCRKVRGKNTRVTYLYQTAFDQESLDIIVKALKKPGEGSGEVVEVFSNDVGEGASTDEKKGGSGGEESGESSDENDAESSEKSEGELTSEESESANNKEIKGETDADVPEEGSDENSAKGNGEERHECRDKENGRGIDDGVGEEPGATRRLEPRKRGKLIY